MNFISFLKELRMASEHLSSGVFRTSSSYL